MRQRREGGGGEAATAGGRGRDREEEEAAAADDDRPELEVPSEEKVAEHLLPVLHVPKRRPFANVSWSYKALFGAAALAGLAVQTRPDGEDDALCSAAWGGAAAALYAAACAARPGAALRGEAAGKFSRCRLPHIR